MPIGLKRGVVELADHDPEWEQLARETIERLWHVFGSIAKDIQHVGSTSIRGIKAKPCIDIAVAVNNPTEVKKLIPALEEAGFLYRPDSNKDWNIFFVYSDVNLGTRTHHVHVVQSESDTWYEFVRFRDYLNNCPQIAKDYEAVKLSLMEKYKHDRPEYTKEKHKFIAKTLKDAQIWACLHEILVSTTFTKIEPLNKGWSSDKKYYSETSDGRRFLLRVADILEYDRKKYEFEMMQRVATLNVPMSQPIDFRVCEGGKKVYSLLTWCDGQDAEVALPMLTESEQYVLGVKAGEILRKIHSIPAPETQEDWEPRFNRKISHKIQKYRECGLRFEGDEKVIAYIEKNCNLLINRPQYYQHGDYHVGNMIVSGKDKISIIDWNRSDFGDPWEEFNRIVWSASISPYFATGQLNGYFAGEPSMEFFKLLAFYIASNTLSSIYWAIPFGQNEIDTMMKQTQDALRWFDNMQNPVPTWYLKQCEST